MVGRWKSSGPPWEDARFNKQGLSSWKQVKEDNQTGNQLTQFMQTLITKLLCTCVSDVTTSLRLRLILKTVTTNKLTFESCIPIDESWDNADADRLLPKPYVNIHSSTLYDTDMQELSTSTMRTGTWLCAATTYHTMYSVNYHTDLTSTGTCTQRLRCSKSVTGEHSIYHCKLAYEMLCQITFFSLSCHSFCHQVSQKAVDFHEFWRNFRNAFTLSNETEARVHLKFANFVRFLGELC